jgi:hypothetical protein
LCLSLSLSLNLSSPFILLRNIIFCENIIFQHYALLMSVLALLIVRPPRLAWVSDAYPA